jgi:FtsH-binding integral membrane protein
MTGQGRHMQLTPNWLLKQWLLACPILLCVVVGVMLAIADGLAAHLLVLVALVVGVVTGSVWLPVGEGRAAPQWLVLMLLVFLGFGGLWLLSLTLGVDRLYVLGWLVVALMTYCIVAAFRIVRRREISWRQVVASPWRGPKRGPWTGP